MIEEIHRNPLEAIRSPIAFATKLKSFKNVAIMTFLLWRMSFEWFSLSDDIWLKVELEDSLPMAMTKREAIETYYFSTGALQGAIEMGQGIRQKL